MKTYQIAFYRKPEGKEIGPMLELENVQAKSMKAAMEYAKSTAHNHNWRLVQVYDITSTLETIA